MFGAPAPSVLGSVAPRTLPAGAHPAASPGAGSGGGRHAPGRGGYERPMSSEGSGQSSRTWALTFAVLGIVAVLGLLLMIGVLET